MRIPERYEQFEGDGGDTTLPIHVNTDLTVAYNDDSTLAIELAAIENNIGHSGNEIDMTDMENTTDTIADLITHQAIRLISIRHSGNEIDMTDIECVVFLPLVDAEQQCRSELLFPSHFCVRGEVSYGRKQIFLGHFPGCIPGNVADPSSSSVQ